MSLLDNTRSKVDKVREITSPFNIMGVHEILVESDFRLIEEIIDRDKLSDLKLIKSDNIPVVGSYGNDDMYRRLAYYICRYHLEHPCDNKLFYDDIHLKGKPRLSIVMWISLDERWKRTLYVSLPNGARMIIKYGI